MRIRYFLGIAIIFIAIIAGYAFYITPDYYTLTNTLWYDFTLTLPIAVWLILPACVVFILAYFFMLLSMFVQKIKVMRTHRDLEKINTQIQEQLLGNPVRERSFGSEEFGMLSKILARFHLLPNLHSSVSGNEKIDLDFQALQEIQQGRENSKIKLNPRHPLYKSNIKNSLHDDAQKSFDYLRQDFSIEAAGISLYKDCDVRTVYNQAWEIILNGNSKIAYKALKLEQTHLTFTTLMQLIRACTHGKIELSKDILVQSCKSVTLSEREYLAIVIEVCEMLNENNINFWLGVFEQLSKEVEISVFAYFYILLEVGKTSEALELKQQYPKNDFLPVSAFIHLKEKGYPLLVFFDPLLYRSRKASDDKNSKLLNPKISN